MGRQGFGRRKNVCGFFRTTNFFCWHGKRVLRTHYTKKRPRRQSKRKLVQTTSAKFVGFIGFFKMPEQTTVIRSSTLRDEPSGSDSNERGAAFLTKNKLWRQTLVQLFLSARRASPATVFYCAPPESSCCPSTALRMVREGW